MDGRIAVVVITVAYCAVTGARTQPNAQQDVPTLVGPNVCTYLRPYLEKVTVVDYKINKFTQSYFCIKNLRFRCTKSIEYPVEISTEKIVEKFQTVHECCDGYKPALNNSHCQPVCEQPCIRGKCILPNVCECDKNHEGPLCAKTKICPIGKYGYDCQQTCQCRNNATCDQSDGVCLCQPGYVGKNCESPCPPGYFGNECDHRCKCLNGATCNPENGSCNCQPGFVGRYCQTLYVPWIYRKSYENNCNCNWYTTESCDPLTGECKCKHNLQGDCYCDPGWTGLDCKKVCPPGKFGIGCNLTCKCLNDTICRSTDGVCLCKPGFYGPTCSKVCPKNFYGESCLNKCNCKENEEICDSVKGCICDPRLPGDSCNGNLRLLSENKHAKWLVKMLFSIIFLITGLTCAGVLICLYFYWNYVKKSNQENTCNRDFLQDSTYSETNSSIGSGPATFKYQHHAGGVMLSLGKSNFFVNDSFNAENARRHCIVKYESTENLYLEIGESSSTRPDNLYDRLDFLRPTGTWKPHYLDTSILQEQSRSCSNTEEKK